MTNEQLRMQMLSGIITEGEYKLRLNEDMEALQNSLRKEIERILYGYVDDINNAQGIDVDDLEEVAGDIVDYIMVGLNDIAGSQK
jgi:hypothetical protein